MDRPISRLHMLNFASAVIAALALAIPAAAQNLYVSGRIGVATESPFLPLHVARCTGQSNCAAGDASLAGGCCA